MLGRALSCPSWLAQELEHLSKPLLPAVESASSCYMSYRPFMFRTQSKEVYESGGYQTSGVDIVVTAERVILLDTQPILSETLLEQLSHNENSIPPGLSPDAYLEVMVCCLCLHCL